MLTSFSALLALSLPNCDSWQEKYLHVTLMLVVLTNVGVNVLQVKKTFFKKGNAWRVSSGRFIRRFREISAGLRRMRNDRTGEDLITWQLVTSGHNL